VNAGLLTLESEGAILRGTFEGPNEWCDRRLLARIHRYTLNRLRAEIEPVTAADFTRFLFAWQNVSSRLSGIDGLRRIVQQLDGCEVAATAWEKFVLPSRMDRYDSSLLDTLCLGGEIGWAKSSNGIVLFVREHADTWLSGAPPPPAALSDAAQQILDNLRARGASFLEPSETLDELLAAGLITSDGFFGRKSAGRWSLVPDANQDVEVQARSLLKRYGVVFRRMVTRENAAAPWRELARVYRRLEARGEIRGGRFVTGMSGEQFALPEAVERLREIRREGPDGRLIVISAADPLNLTGILTPGERVGNLYGNRVLYRDGVPIAVKDGGETRILAATAPEDRWAVEKALVTRSIPPGLRPYLGKGVRG